MADNNNGRIKIGKLEGQMGEVLKGLGEIKGMLRENDKHTNVNAVKIAVNESKIKGVTKYVWAMFLGLAGVAFWIIRKALT